MENRGSPKNPKKPNIPFGQIFMDDMFLLLMIGIVVPFIIYLAWGYIDIGSIPPLPESVYSAVASNTQQPSQRPAPDGAQLVINMGCIGCHSTDGSTRVGPSWMGLFGNEHPMEDGSLVLADEAYIERSILEPDAQISHGFKSGIMPSFAGKISEEEIKAIIEYIKGLE